MKKELILIPITHQTTVFSEIKHSDEELTELDELVIYTDGSCYPNPDGIAGSAMAVYKKVDSGLVKIYETSVHFDTATSQRAEIQGMLEALKYLSDKKFHFATIKTDSQYVANTFNKNRLSICVKSYMKRPERGLQLANPDMWSMAWSLYNTHRISIKRGPECKIEIVWIKGHNGDPQNEYVDDLAGKARLFRTQLEKAK